jgi:hypothetical protein
MICGEDGWTDRTSCEVDTLASQASEHDLGAAGRDGRYYGIEGRCPQVETSISRWSALLLGMS